MVQIIAMFIGAAIVVASAGAAWGLAVQGFVLGCIIMLAAWVWNKPC
jgi:hypothetical protein